MQSADYKDPFRAVSADFQLVVPMFLWVALRFNGLGRGSH